MGLKKCILKSLNDDATDILSSQSLQLNQFKLVFIAIWAKYAMTEQIFVDFEAWFIRKNAKIIQKRLENALIMIGREQSFFGVDASFFFQQ